MGKEKTLTWLTKNIFNYHIFKSKLFYNNNFSFNYRDKVAFDNDDIKIAEVVDLGVIRSKNNLKSQN
jgi:hypothetical protein